MKAFLKISITLVLVFSAVVFAAAGWRLIEFSAVDIAQLRTVGNVNISVVDYEIPTGKLLVRGLEALNVSQAQVVFDKAIVTTDLMALRDLLVVAAFVLWGITVVNVVVLLVVFSVERKNRNQKGK